MIEGFKLLGLGYRMWKYVGKEKAAGRIPIIDPFSTHKQGIISIDFRATFEKNVGNY